MVTMDIDQRKAAMVEARKRSNAILNVPPFTLAQPDSPTGIATTEVYCYEEEDRQTRRDKRMAERARRRCEAIAERRQEEARIIEQRHAPNVDARIERKIAEHRKLWIDVHAQAIAHERKLVRAEISDAVGSLRADLTIEKAAERREQGDVTDIPQFL
jgi:hypothetical protein